MVRLAAKAFVNAVLCVIAVALVFVCETLQPHSTACADSVGDAAVAQAQSYVDEADAAVSQLASLEDSLRAAYEGFLAVYSGSTEASSQVKGIISQYNALQERMACVRQVCASIDSGAYSLSDEELFVGVLSGKLTPSEAESYDYLLGKIRTGLQGAYDESLGQSEALEAEYGQIIESYASEHATIQDAIDSCNVAAAALEDACSVIRQNDRAAESTLADVAAPTASSQLASIEASHNESRAQAQALVGEWYEALDQIGGVSGSLTFGTGADFSLSEDDFVAKWGTAIDAFYAKRGSALGVTLPLQGYGETMARYAYRYRIDPRLCAAVSMAESSGGLQCIRAYNAWGWGAADSDPYGLASEWASWDAGIGGWYTGMATSDTGLAVAASLTALGDIYASDPAWASHVMMYMAEITP